MASIILFVDPDEKFLAAVDEALGRHFALETVTSGADALKIAKKADAVAIVVASLALPDMDGVDLLSALRKLSPATSRVAVTKADDFKGALRAVNEAGVQHILLRPFELKALAPVLKQGLNLYQTQVRERQTLQDTLRGSVKVLVDLLELVDPHALGRSRRIRDRVLRLARRLKLKSAWQMDLAIMLSHIGCVVLPPEITRKLDDGRDLTPEEQKLFFRHPAVAAKLLSNISRMATVAQIILHQNSRYSDKTLLESRILKVALDMDRQERKGLDPAQALEVLRKRAELYDPAVLKALAELESKAVVAALEVPLEDLQEGMVMARDLVNKDKTVLLLKGQALSKVSLARLKMFSEELGLSDPVAVVRPAS